MIKNLHHLTYRWNFSCMSFYPQVTQIPRGICNNKILQLARKCQYREVLSSIDTNQQLENNKNTQCFSELSQKWSLLKLPLTRRCWVSRVSIAVWWIQIIFSVQRTFVTCGGCRGCRFIHFLCCTSRSCCGLSAALHKRFLPLIAKRKFDRTRLTRRFARESCKNYKSWQKKVIHTKRHHHLTHQFCILRNNLYDDLRALFVWQSSLWRNHFPPWHWLSPFRIVFHCTLSRSTRQRYRDKGFAQFSEHSALAQWMYHIWDLHSHKKFPSRNSSPIDPQWLLRLCQRKVFKKNPWWFTSTSCFQFLRHKEDDKFYNVQGHDSIIPLVRVNYLLIIEIFSSDFNLFIFERSCTLRRKKKK